MPILRPPRYENVPKKSPLVFLIGPIQGTSDWQMPVAHQFIKAIPGMHVFSPRSDMWEPGLSEEEHDRRFKLQEHWEHTYIRAVIRRICDRPVGEAPAAIFAWCAKEETHNPKRAYAQTTRYEVGKILGYVNGMLGRDIFLDEEPVTLPDGVFIGADGAFTGRQYLAIDLTNDHRTLYSSVEEMQAATIKYLLGKI